MLANVGFFEKLFKIKKKKKKKILSIFLTPKTLNYAVKTY